MKEKKNPTILLMQTFDVFFFLFSKITKLFFLKNKRLLQVQKNCNIFTYVQHCTKLPQNMWQIYNLLLKLSKTGAFWYTYQGSFTETKQKQSNKYSQSMFTIWRWLWKLHRNPCAVCTPDQWKIMDLFFGMFYMISKEI